MTATVKISSERLVLFYISVPFSFKVQLTLFLAFVSNYLSYKIKHFWEIFFLSTLKFEKFPPSWFMAASWRKLAIAANDVSAKIWPLICNRKHYLIMFRFWNWHSTNSFVYSPISVATVYFLDKFRTGMTSLTFITSPLQDTALNQDGGNLSSIIKKSNIWPKTKGFRKSM